MEHTYLQKVRILIVDDQSFNRRLLRGILGALGCRRVTEAKSVELAWSSLLLSAPDLVIVDWEMGDVDGLELVRRIRHEEDTPDRFMPIIMLTAHSEMPRIETARDAGVNEFVVKPISVNTLFSRIQAVIEKPRPYIRINNFFGPDRRRKDMPFEKPDRRTGRSTLPDSVGSDEPELDQDEINTLMNPGEGEGEVS